ncbi:hypothetical protein Tco_0588981, partial [Tanacetum coccineum]
VEDSDSLMEEIDLFLASDDSMPPGIEIDDYDSEGDIRFLEELLNNDSLPLPENESSNLDHFNDPSPSRPPPEPPDVEICFDFKPDTGVVTNKVVGDISEHDVLMPNLLPTQPTLCPVFDLLLPFSSENEDKVFNPAQLVSLVELKLKPRGRGCGRYEVLYTSVPGGGSGPIKRDTVSFLRVSVRGRRVSGMRSECMDPCQSLAIMRRGLVKWQKEHNNP